MVLRARFTLPPDRQGEEILLLGGATWANYERLLEERGDRSALTLLASFLDRPRTSQAIREYTEALRALA